MVPVGASAHTYEPTARQMMAASQGDIWFRIGEPFETKAIQALKSHHPQLKIIDLRHGLDLIAHHPHHKGCCSGSEDLHFWLSARLAEIQADTIAKALSAAYPEHQELYQRNLRLFKDKLKKLDQELGAILKPLHDRSILVSHPAYAYFCRDYHLQQYSIEVEGKDPTPQQLMRLLALAKDVQAKRIYVQPQYSNKAAQLIANEIGATLITLDPYSKDYFTSMKAIAKAFAGEQRGE
jgi:zinc transport system substrate-binding protein